jgi:hypothetical protein
LLSFFLSASIKYILVQMVPRSAIFSTPGYLWLSVIMFDNVLLMCEDVLPCAVICDHVLRGGSRIFRTSVKCFLADGALSALGVVSTGRGRLQAGWGEWALNNFYADSPPLDF